MSPEELMQLAIDKCREGIAAGQTPFGCAIARDGEVIAVAHNTVWQTTDITAHAEINALREACLHTGDVHLERAVVATTCEPCPMCAAALHWARVETIYIGASIEDAASAGFNELPLPASRIFSVGANETHLQPGILADECRGLFAQWQAREERKAY